MEAILTHAQTLVYTLLNLMPKRRYAAIVGVRCDRKLDDGRQVRELVKQGQQVRLAVSAQSDRRAITCLLDSLPLLSGVRLLAVLCKLYGLKWLYALS